MTGFATNTNSARDYYADIGFDTIPLPPNSKQAVVSGWQSRSSLSLWQDSNGESNLAIRCGGKVNLAVIDCDEKKQKGTFTNAVQFMAGLGLSPGNYPVIQTASGIGRHIYLKLENALKGDWKGLNAELGAGEFRYGTGAYVVAPPSIIHAPYSLLAGGFDRLPTLTRKDVLPLIQGNIEFAKYQIKPETRTNISRDAWQLLKGNLLEKYNNDRSRAEQGLITSLVNSGYDFPHTLNLFIKYPGPGKFKEKYIINPKMAIGYLMHNYESAIRWTTSNTSPGRQRAQEAFNWAISRPWLGASGAYDWAVFLAHANIAWQCGEREYQASARTLADAVNISHMAATNANRRLQALGFIENTQNAVANLANKYRLGEMPLIIYPSSINPSAYSSHDVFSYQALGKSSEQIWFYLQNCPKRLAVIVEQTGRSKPTAIKRLDEMSKIIDIRTGEVHSMVYLDNGLWHANKKINLDFIAELLGVSGILKQRKRLHQLQREIHNRALEWGRRSGGSANV